jgi:site-specific DNA recombinase
MQGHDGPAVRRDSAVLQSKIAAIDSQLAEAVRVSPAVALLLADDDQTLIDRWSAASPDIKGKIVSELMDVVVMPATRGVRTFDPDLIEVNWH